MLGLRYTWMVVVVRDPVPSNEPAGEEEGGCMSSTYHLPPTYLARS